MKKLILLLVTLIGILFLSCNSIDSQISRYEKACKAGDLEKASKIASNLEKKSDKITDEQAMRILNASMNCSESVNDSYKDMYESLSSDDDDDDF